MSAAPVSLLLVLVTLPALVLSFCSYGKPEIQTTAHGDLEYCLYKTVKILPGAKFRDLEECVEVQCTKTEYTKCGFGKKAGIMFPPLGCKVAFKGCSVLTIQDPNSGTKCPVIDE